MSKGVFKTYPSIVEKKLQFIRLSLIIGAVYNLVGLFFIFAPKAALSFFNFPGSEIIWTRMFGVFMLLFSAAYGFAYLDPLSNYGLVLFGAVKEWLMAFVLLIHYIYIEAPSSVWTFIILSALFASLYTYFVANTDRIRY